MKKSIIASSALLTGFIILPPNVVAEEFSLELKQTILVFDKSNLKEYKLLIKNTGTTNVELTPVFYTLRGLNNMSSSVSLEKRDDTLEKQISLRENGNVVSSVKLDPLESRQISIKYQFVDSTANDFFTIVWENNSASNSSTEESSTRLVPGLGTIIIATDSKASQAAPKVSFQSNRFQKDGPITFKAQISNPGEHVMIIKPQVKIKNVLQQEVGTIDIPTQYILPKTDRNLLIQGKSLEWDDKLLLGPYIATLKTETQGGYISLNSSTTYVFPVLPILVVSIIIFFIIGVWLRVRKNN